MTSFVVDFEPGLHGPFPSREAADAWALQHVDGNGSWTVATLREPHVETAEPVEGSTD